MSDLLSIRDISKIYEEGQTQVCAVNHVSLTIQPGQVVLILGPSGSGKTTLLSIMGCLLSPTHGQVWIGDQNVYRLSDGELSRLRCEQIGFVFQSFNLLNFLTARKNVEVALNLAGKRGREARERADQVLRQVQLGHRLDFAPRNLSGGEKQRVSIARALANRPRLLLADEPTGNLDSQTGQSLGQLIRDLAKNEGTGVVVVTHDNRIENIADRILYLEDGILKDEKIIGNA